MVDKKKGMRFVICIDEIDALLGNAPSEEDARTIIQILSMLLTDPDLAVRLLLTTKDKEVMRRYPEGSVFLDNLDTLKVPLCTEEEMKDLIERFEMPLQFEDDALSCIFHYSGGQIYFIKLAVRLALSLLRTSTAEKRINGQMIDELINQLIKPTQKTSIAIRSMHETVFPTMKSIFLSAVSEEERLLMDSLRKAHGVLKVSNLKTSLVQIGNLLYERGYFSKVAASEGEEYRWRIGIWQLFLENYDRPNYSKAKKK